MSYRNKTGVTAGTYARATATSNAEGRLTTLANGAAHVYEFGRWTIASNQTLGTSGTYVLGAGVGFTTASNTLTGVTLTSSPSYRWNISQTMTVYIRTTVIILNHQASTRMTLAIINGGNTYYSHSGEWNGQVVNAGITTNVVDGDYIQLQLIITNGLANTYVTFGSVTLTKIYG